MEHLIYISSKEDKYVLRPVRLISYTDCVSFNSFKNNILKVSLKMSQKLGNMKVYALVPSFSNKDEFDRDNKIGEQLGCKPLFKLTGEPVSLMEYYKEIGYTHKTKKFNGLTIRQYLKKGLY